MTMLDDEKDKIILAEIYENYKTDMLRFALSITGNKEMAEDAVHDAFLSIIKHKDKIFALSSKEKRAMVIVITKCRCIDLLRKKKHIADESIEDMEYSLETNDIPVEKQVIIIDEYNTIKKHIASLDESSRIVLEMKYVLGMSYKEIGEELGMTAKHIDTKIMRAKDKVRKLLVSGGVQDDKQQIG